MRNISERHLAVLIPLLHGKIGEMERELEGLQGSEAALSDEQAEDYCELQECIEQYHEILDTLRREYEAGLSEISNLPSFEELTRHL